MTSNASRTLQAEFEFRILEQNLQIAQVLGSAIAMRDHETGAHNLRVALYSATLGEALGLDAQSIRDLVSGAFLHDLGKIAIPDHVLLKAGPLSAGEWEIMRRHCEFGARLLEQLPAFRNAIPVVRHHHEWYDGTGYPDRLSGEDIPLLARAFAVVDVFDAVVSVRPYKPAMPVEKALEHLEAGKGAHFDPRLVSVFVGLAPQLHRRLGGLSEEGLLPQVVEARRRFFGV